MRDDGQEARTANRRTTKILLLLVIPHAAFLKKKGGHKDHPYQVLASNS
jgi:hypothetical protein